MPVGLSIDLAPLRAAVGAMKAADRDLRRDINQRTRQANPEWQRAVDRHARTAQDRALVRTGTRVAAGNPPTLQAATSKRPMSRRRKGRGTLIPARDYAYIEFGSNRDRTGRLPRRAPSGRIVYPAVADFAPVMAGRWAQAIRDAYVERARVGEVTRG